MLRHIHVATEHIAGLTLVGSGEIQFVGLGQIVDNEFVHPFHVGQLRFAAVRFAVQADGQRAEDAHQIEVGIGTPEVGLSEGDVAFGGRSLRATGIVDEVVGQLDDLVVLIPCSHHALVVGRCAESIELCAGLFVRSRVGCDVIALPLGVLHVGVRLRLRHLREQGVDAHVEFVLRGVERLGSEASFGFLIEEIRAGRGAEEGRGEESGEEYIAFHDEDRN